MIHRITWSEGYIYSTMLEKSEKCGRKPEKAKNTSQKTRKKVDQDPGNDIFDSGKAVKTVSAENRKPFITIWKPKTRPQVLWYIITNHMRAFHVKTKFTLVYIWWKWSWCPGPCGLSNDSSIFWKLKYCFYRKKSKPKGQNKTVVCTVGLNIKYLRV